MTKAEIMVKWVREQLGCPYVFGARGQTCTPDYRRAVMKSKPLYALKIKANCPVLKGKQATCAGCKYEGKPCYDCRGLTARAVEVATGRPIMGAGATSQWAREDNWAEKGLIKNIPPGKPCAVFRRKLLVMSHTGFCTGDGLSVHAAGHDSGVISSPMPHTWTHYAVPVGLEGEVQMILLSKGDRGAKVKTLQETLLKRGYPLPKSVKNGLLDGAYGKETEAAVRAFQAAMGLPVTGNWSQADEDRAAGQAPAPRYKVTIPALTALQRDALLKLYPKATVETEAS
jgi:hypothetical protein